MDVFDVIVVGGGISGGIPAATYLQKAGLKVAIVEARPESGNFCPTHETWPETLDSPHASINFSAALRPSRTSSLSHATATSCEPPRSSWAPPIPTGRTA